MRILINPTNFGPTYFLDNNSVSTVVQIWKNLNSIGSQDKFIETAIERFNFAFSRKRTEDKLTDFITSLEALLLSADEKSELEYRLSLRLASLIGVNANEKTLVRKILKSAYIQRSCIVHGKKVKIAQVDGKKYSTEDLSVLMEDYTRKTVRIFMTLINKGVNQEDFLDKLDDGILTAENILTVFKISIDGE